MNDACVQCGDNSTIIVYDGGTVDGHYYACDDCKNDLLREGDVAQDKDVVYKVVCETKPEPLADGIDDFTYAKKVAEAKAEEIWNECGVSLYCVVKDSTHYAYFAVRYTPADGGTFHTPIEYYQSVGA